MAVQRLLEQGGPVVVASGGCNPLFDAVIGFLNRVSPGFSGANAAPGAEENQCSKKSGGFHGVGSGNVLGLSVKSVGLGIDPRHS